MGCRTVPGGIQSSAPSATIRRAARMDLPIGLASRRLRSNSSMASQSCSRKANRIASLPPSKGVEVRPPVLAGHDDPQVDQHRGGVDVTGQLCGRCSPQLRRNDSRTPGAVFRHDAGGPEWRPFDACDGERSPFIHWRVPRSIATSRECARWRCTHRKMTAALVQIGAGGTAFSSLDRQQHVAGAAMTPLFSTNARQDVTGALGTYGPLWRWLRRY
jgi:hypothetical protein